MTPDYEWTILEGARVYGGNTFDQSPLGVALDCELVLRFEKRERVRAIHARAFAADAYQPRSLVMPTEDVSVRVAQINDDVYEGVACELYKLSRPLECDSVALRLESDDVRNLHWFAVVWCELDGENNDRRR